MQLLQFQSLKEIPNLHHAVTTRDGGISSGEYASLNLAFHVGDEPEKVRENRRILSRELGFEIENLVAAQQVHGDGVRIVSTKNQGSGARDFQSAIPNTDALITDKKNLPLLILVADCAPILLVDPKNQVLAVVHAGWRGALAKIASKTVLKMHSNFGSAPEDILAGIGPCLSTENLEIGFEVAAQIEAVDANAIVSGFEKPHLDLRGLIERDLQSAGIIPQKMETMLFCTKDDARFFSHRGQNGVTGRFGIVAWWA
ncbi:hypothetical protein B1R32_102128 [Abditibacterium utsteinense]|uniref:Purine nucleoside phosphorylase n=1 Tax=Abditibacterium utsteinense TaxID=1960156 RepID=A0A2S8SWD7_9BACT|nr:peptidoglycan editing factor PgeF [Abditibacterium utsteinense]PQV65121.1 hypothetical protein B1R32_102128 [Abditibacterium utsteinense]